MLIITSAQAAAAGRPGHHSPSAPGSPPHQPPLPSTAQLLVFTSTHYAAVSRQSMQYWIGPMNYFMLASRGCFIQDKSTWYYITTLCACFGWIIIVKLLRWIDLKSRYYILHTPAISSLHMRGGSPVEQVTILCQTACLCYCDSQGSGY